MLNNGGFVLNLYTFFLAVMLLIFQENDKKASSNRAFVRLTGLLTFLVGISAIGDLGTVLGGDYFILAKISTFCVFAFDPLGFIFSLYYIDGYTIYADEDKRKAFLIPMSIYGVINFILVSISQLFGLGWFYYYENNIYHRGDLYLIRGFIHVILCIVVMAYVVVFRKGILKHYRLPIVLFPLIVAFGGFLQVAVINMNLEYAATVFACLMLFICVQKRDVNLDYLTGVANRRGIDSAMKRAISGCMEKDFAAVMIDVDYFKTINDKFGHKAGDEVLECIADVLRESFDDEDIVGRFGGDEFCVITWINDLKELNRRIDIIRDSIACLDWSNKSEMDLSISAGAAVYDKNSGMKVKEFMESIDRRMYEEKLRHHISDRRNSMNA